MSYERDLDEAKVRLIQQPDFNLVDCFKLFEFSGRGWANIDDFKAGLSSLGVFPALADLELAFRRFDTDKDGVLRYSEFCDMFTPKSPEYAHMLGSRDPYYIHKPYYRREDFFHGETRHSIAGLFRTLFSVESAAETI